MQNEVFCHGIGRDAQSQSITEWKYLEREYCRDTEYCQAFSHVEVPAKFDGQNSEFSSCAFMPSVHRYRA